MIRDVAKYTKHTLEGRSRADRSPRVGAARRDPHHAVGDALLHSVPCRTCSVGHARVNLFKGWTMARVRTQG